MRPGKKTWRPRIRSLEDPRVPLDPWGPGADPSGGSTSSGVRVTRDIALTLAGWWRGVSLIARTVGRLPIAPHKNLRPGVAEDPDHQAHYLLTKAPNDFMRPHALKATLVAHAVSEGNGYAAIERDGLARPTALLPLDPTRVEPVLSGGRLVYFYRMLDGREEPLPASDVFHLPGLGFDGVRGYRVLALAAEALGLGLATQKYGSTFFRHSARPNIVLQHPLKVSPEAMKRLREDWERIYGGADNAHRTAVLAEGMTAQALTINARDAQLIETKTFSLLDVANFLHIPPHKLGSSANVSYASLEQENQAFLDDCISPWLTAFEEECEAKLLTQYQRDRDTHSVRFDRAALVVADEAARYAAYTQGIASGVVSQDECREREGLNPIPGGIGAKYYRPANLVELDPADRPKPAPVAPPPAKDANGNPPAPEPPPGPKPRSDGSLAAALRSIVAEAAGRCLRKAAHQAERAARRPGEFLAWLDTLEVDPAPLEGPARALAMADPAAPDAGALAASLRSRVRAALLEASGRARDAGSLASECAAAFAALEKDPLGGVP